MPDEINDEECGKELADVICYACLIAAKMNIDLESVLIKKFNEVSDRVKSKIKISEQFGLVYSDLSYSKLQGRDEIKQLLNSKY